MVQAGLVSGSQRPLGYKDGSRRHGKHFCEGARYSKKRTLWHETVEPKRSDESNHTRGSGGRPVV
jgi:hypothetical protein